MRFEVQVQTNNPLSAARLLLMENQLRRYEDDWAKGLIKEARVYPPLTPAQQAGHGYKRTYKFRNSWRRIRSTWRGSDLVVEVQNPTPYAPKVVGDARGQGQAGINNIHVGRWYIFRNLAESRGFAAGVQRIIDQNIAGINYLVSLRP